MMIITKIQTNMGIKYWVHAENNNNRRDGFWTWNKWTAEEKVAAN